MFFVVLFSCVFFFWKLKPPSFWVTLCHDMNKITGSQALPQIHEVFAGDPRRMDRPKVVGGPCWR